MSLLALGSVLGPIAHLLSFASRLATKFGTKGVNLGTLKDNRGGTFDLNFVKVFVANMLDAIDFEFDSALLFVAPGWPTAGTWL